MPSIPLILTSYRLKLLAHLCKHEALRSAKNNEIDQRRRDILETVGARVLDIIPSTSGTTTECRKTNKLKGELQNEFTGIPNTESRIALSENIRSLINRTLFLSTIFGDFKGALRTLDRIENRVSESILGSYQTDVVTYTSLFAGLSYNSLISISQLKILKTRMRTNRCIPLSKECLLAISRCCLRLVQFFPNSMEMELQENGPHSTRTNHSPISFCSFEDKVIMQYITENETTKSDGDAFLKNIIIEYNMKKSEKRIDVANEIECSDSWFSAVPITRMIETAEFLLEILKENGITLDKTNDDNSSHICLWGYINDWIKNDIVTLQRCVTPSTTMYTSIHNGINDNLTSSISYTTPPPSKEDKNDITSKYIIIRALLNFYGCLCSSPRHKREVISMKGIIFQEIFSSRLERLVSVISNLGSKDDDIGVEKTIDGLSVNYSDLLKKTRVDCFSYHLRACGIHGWYRDAKYILFASRNMSTPLSLASIDDLFRSFFGKTVTQELAELVKMAVSAAFTMNRVPNFHPFSRGTEYIVPIIETITIPSESTTLINRPVADPHVGNRTDLNINDNNLYDVRLRILRTVIRLYTSTPSRTSWLDGWKILRLIEIRHNKNPNSGCQTFNVFKSHSILYIIVDSMRRNLESAETDATPGLVLYDGNDKLNRGDVIRGGINDQFMKGAFDSIVKYVLSITIIGEFSKDLLETLICINLDHVRSSHVCFEILNYCFSKQVPLGENLLKRIRAIAQDGDFVDIVSLVDMCLYR